MRDSNLVFLALRQKQDTPSRSWHIGAGIVLCVGAAAVALMLVMV